MARRRGEAGWAKEIASWRSSGASAAQFAARRGYSAASLLRWSKRTPVGADDVQFVRLEIAPAAERRRELIVEVGAARIRVGMEFDPAHLRAIVEALSHEASE